MRLSNCRILVTGADGFIGKNLVVRLNELSNVSVATFVRGDDAALLPKMLSQVDAVVHLAGENRPADEAAFAHVNAGLTSALCKAIEQEFRSTGRHIPLVLASSTQAERDNPYGRSKLAAEGALQTLAKETGNPCVIFRLPGVFGKWCKPNYNSVVATFCHNIARDLPIQINDPTASLRLVYVDDVVTALLAALEAPVSGCVQALVEPEYTVTLGELANQIRAFGNCRATLMTERVGTGFVRALYATYVSYLPNEKFSYSVPQHADPRGVFVEMLKTPDSGQFSYFTAHPGITRGGHYHHTKTEKFLVIKGEALFRFRHLLTNEMVELRTRGGTPQVVDTIPGWTHDITNVGNDEMVVMLWANENFDRTKPDTVTSKV
ncbi:MAG: UDP-2-acetamido-2,6-beta-L-arabino-hexul-4-ose reductase [Burkholderiaceae bacterium]